MDGAWASGVSLVYSFLYHLGHSLDNLTGTWKNNDVPKNSGQPRNGFLLDSPSVCLKPNGRKAYSEGQWGGVPILMPRLGERTENMSTLVQRTLGKPTVTTHANAHALSQGLPWASIFASYSLDLHSSWKQKPLLVGKIGGSSQPAFIFYLKWPFLCSDHGFHARYRLGTSTA